MAEILNVFQHGPSKYSSQARRLDVQPKSVTYERKHDPNADLMEFDRSPLKVIDKPVTRLVEVLKPVPVDKVVERVRERAEVTEVCKDGYVNTVYDEMIRIEEKVKNVVIERIIHKEVVQEVVVDKIIDLVIEVIREVPVTRVVERKVEVIEEVPMVRFIDRVITKPVVVTRVVERVVEVIKEVPVETVREVPVYVRVDATTGQELQSRDRVNWTNRQPAPTGARPAERYEPSRYPEASYYAPQQGKYNAPTTEVYAQPPAQSAQDAGAPTRKLEEALM